MKKGGYFPILAAVSILAGCATSGGLEFESFSDERDRPPPPCAQAESKCREYERSRALAKGKNTLGMDLLRADCEESRIACSNASSVEWRKRPSMDAMIPDRR